MRRAIILLPALVFLVVSHAQSPALIGYWQNWNDANAPYIALDQVDPRYNVIEIAFAEPVGGTTYAMDFAPAIGMPPDLIAQVAAQQALGKKVLLSVGGANATVQLNSDTERDSFVYTLTSLLTTYGFDGLDIDLEGSSVSISGGTIDAPVDPTIIRLINAIQEIMLQYRQTTGNKLFLTMAPETAYVQGGMSAFGGIWGAYLPIIDALRDSLDILQVQLYNSGSMYGIDGAIYAQGTADFIVSQTEALIQGFSTGGGSFDGLPPEKVAVALPACGSAAGGGYTDTATVRAAMQYLLGEGPQPGSYTLVQPGGYPALRGMMTWSINWDAVSTCDGMYSYAENFERIFADVSTGLDVAAVASFTTAPNPVDEVLHFSIALDGPVAIHDLSGTLVWSAGPSSARSSFDVRAFAPGIYVLSGECAGQPVRSRFVKR